MTFPKSTSNNTWPDAAGKKGRLTLSQNTFKKTNKSLTGDHFFYLFLLLLLFCFEQSCLLLKWASQTTGCLSSKQLASSTYNWVGEQKKDF